MAVLTIRNLPDEVRNRLRLRAAAAGRSMEAEARTILSATCLDEREVMPAADLQAWVDALYGQRKPRRTVETLIRERRREAARE